MADLLTLKSSDRDYDEFLRGTFSSSRRAIPLYHRTTEKQEREIIFELKDLEMIERPSLLRIWWKAIRPSYLTYTLSPMLSAFAVLWARGVELNLLGALSSFLSVALLQMSAHLINDYFDHLRGTDHVRWRGSQIIQDGWLPAHAIQKGAFVLLLAALLASIPTAFQHIEVFAIIGLIGFLGVISFSGQKISLKDQGWGEVSLFLLSGPFLLGGFSWVVVGSLDQDLLFLSLVFGFVTALSYFLKNFEELIGRDRMPSESLARWLGFDRGQKFAIHFLTLLPFLFFTYALVEPEIFGIWAFLGFVSFLPLWPMLRSLRSIGSCLSSESRKLRKMGLRLHWFLGLAVALVFLSAHWIRIPL